MAEKENETTEGQSAESMASERAGREKSFSRRALIQAGWTVPIVVAVDPVRKVAAGIRPTGSPFGDDPFSDLPFNDFFDFGCGGGS